MPIDPGAFFRSGLESAQAAEVYIPQTEALKSQYELAASQNKSALESKAYLDKVLKEASQDTDVPEAPGVPGLAENVLPGETAGTPDNIKLGPQGFGGTPTPKEGLTGLGGMQQGVSGFEPTPEQPKSAPHVIQRLNESKEKVSNSQRLMQTYEKAIGQAMKDGKSDVVSSLSKQLNEQKESDYKAQKENLANQKEVLELGGKIGTGYLDAIASDPSQEPIAWAQLVMQAQKSGIPGDQINKIQTPEQHKAFATQLKGLGEKSSDAIRLEIAKLNNTRQANKDASLNAWKDKNYKYKESKDASDREFKTSEAQLNRGEKLDKDHFDQLHKIVSTSQADRTSIDNELKALQLEKTDLSSLKDLMGPNGKAYTKEERADRLAVVESEINSATELRDQTESRIREGEGLLRQAGIKPPAAAKPDAAKPTASVNVPEKDKPAYQEALQALKDKVPLETVKFNWKKIHGTDFPEAKAEASPAASPAKPANMAKVESIHTQADLDRAIKTRSLTVEEIKLAKARIKTISAATHWWQ